MSAAFPIDESLTVCSSARCLLKKLKTSDGLEKKPRILDILRKCCPFEKRSNSAAATTNHVLVLKSNKSHREPFCSISNLHSRLPTVVQESIQCVTCRSYPMTLRGSQHSFGRHSKPGPAQLCHLHAFCHLRFRSTNATFHIIRD